MSSSTHLIKPNLFDNSKDMGHHTCFGATDLEFPLKVPVGTLSVLRVTLVSNIVPLTNTAKSSSRYLPMVVP